MSRKNKETRVPWSEVRGLIRAASMTAQEVEREACAVLVESFDLHIIGPFGVPVKQSGQPLAVLANAIRARGAKP